MNAVEIQGLTKRYGAITAVDSLDLTVRQGELFALLGVNGAGKTTAFNVITGVYAPTNGRVRFNEACIVRNHPTGKMKKMYKGEHADMYTARFAPEEELDDEALKAWKEGQKALDSYAFTDHVLAPTPDKITALGMARTFQNIRLFGNLTVFENVLIAKHMHAKGGFLAATFHLNGKEETRMRREAMELLEIVGLAELKDETASNLPYGQQRRLEIARALATDPRLLILDEPAAGMNPQETVELTEFIREIREQFDLSILLIEHHMNLVMGISDRIYVLEFGKLIAEAMEKVGHDGVITIDAYLGVDLDA